VNEDSILHSRVFLTTLMKSFNIFKIFKYLFLFFFGSTLLMVFIYRFFPVYYTPLMFIRCYEQVAEGEPVHINHKWVSIDRMSMYMPIAVISSEDNRFMLHNGFDFKAIQQAAIDNEMGRKRRGASTISQQTAKNVFLWPQSSWVRKGFEVYFTFLIEHLWGKQRIMEVYLNSIEMGDGIYGVQAVAKAHFGCSAKELKRGECALIAASLPNPLIFNSGEPSRYMRKRQHHIERVMRYIPHFPMN